MSDETEAKTEVATESSPVRPIFTAADAALVAFLVVLAVVLLLVGAGTVVSMIAGVIGGYMILTVLPLFEERGKDDLGVRRARIYMPLFGVCMLGIVGVGIVGIPPVYAVVPLAIGLILAVRLVMLTGMRVTPHVVLRSIGEKDSGFMELQTARAMTCLLVAVAVFGFDNSFVGSTLREGLTGRERAGVIAAQHKRTADEAREAFERLSEVLDQLLETTKQLAVDIYTQATREERVELLNEIQEDMAADSEPSRANTTILSRFLEIEDDPELRRRIEQMIEADAARMVP